MKKLGNEKEQLIVQHLRQEGKKIYSISRLNTANQCLLEYHKTYNLKEKGVSNPYSEVGEVFHDHIERVYRGEELTNRQFNQSLHDKLIEMDIVGLDFPSEKIKDSYVKDLEHFTRNFSTIEGQFELEKMFVTEVEGIYLMGYIDGIRNHDGKIEVIDWKTSSKFSGKEKLKHAGRQLTLYKLGLEQSSDLKIDNVKWCMLKYVYINSYLKNGKLKQKMVNRGKIVSDMSKTFEKELIKSGLPEIEVGMLLMEAEEKNDLSVLPAIITDNYWLTDCFLEYEVTDEIIKEVKDYVVDTVKMIESKDAKDHSQWNHIDFDKEGTFYCNTLCNHRQHCSAIKEYNKKNQFKKSY